MSFGLALGASTLMSLVLTVLSRQIGTARVYDYSQLKDRVRLIPE